jgi:hypothetical protein
MSESWTIETQARSSAVLLRYPPAARAMRIDPMAALRYE